MIRGILCTLREVNGGTRCLDKARIGEQNRSEERAEADAEAEVDKKSDIDSIDSLICAWGSPMLMRSSHTHAIF
jgi:predicted RNase H-like nuclease